MEKNRNRALFSFLLCLPFNFIALTLQLPVTTNLCCLPFPLCRSSLPCKERGKAGRFRLFPISLALPLLLLFIRRCSKRL